VAFALVLALLTLVPYYWMVLGAFKTVPELNRIPPTFMIEVPTLNSFYDPAGNTPPDHTLGLFQRYPGTEGGFPRYMWNSFAVSA